MKEMVKAAGGQTDEEMFQNLKDAGCSEEIIVAFIEDMHAGRQEQGVLRLRKYRQQLLEDMHIGQKRIDCLDFLLYSLKKGGL